MVSTKVKRNPMYIPNTIMVFELVFKPAICSVNQSHVTFLLTGWIHKSPFLIFFVLKTVGKINLSQR